MTTKKIQGVLYNGKFLSLQVNILMVKTEGYCTIISSPIQSLMGKPSVIKQGALALTAPLFDMKTSKGPRSNIFY